MALAFSSSATIRGSFSEQNKGTPVSIFVSRLNFWVIRKENGSGVS